MVSNQAYLFLVFIVNGVLIGLLFDFFRIARKVIPTNDFVTYIEDVLFWILAGSTVFGAEIKEFLLFYKKMLTFFD